LWQAQDLSVYNSSGYYYMLLAILLFSLYLCRFPLVSLCIVFSLASCFSYIAFLHSSSNHALPTLSCLSSPVISSTASFRALRIFSQCFGIDSLPSCVQLLIFCAIFSWFSSLAIFSRIVVCMFLGPISVCYIFFLFILSTSCVLFVFFRSFVLKRVAVRSSAALNVYD